MPPTKVVNNVMYVGAEVSFHGIQAYDLTKLRNLPRNKEVEIVSPDYITPEIGSTHNIVDVELDDGTKKLIGVGMNPNDKTCPSNADGKLASMAIFDVANDPVHPTFETCVYVDVAAGYVHDIHCVTYHGPTQQYQGSNICALFMEEDIVIYNLDSSEVINTFTYSSKAYVHQGRFSDDHKTLYCGKFTRNRRALLRCCWYASPNFVTSVY